MEKKYTPAPWFAINYGGFVTIQNVDYYDQSDLLDEDKCQEAKANGTLAAYAPELLEALEAVVCIADRKTPEFDAAKAAIAKAKGESEATNG